MKTLKVKHTNFLNKGKILNLKNLLLFVGLALMLSAYSVFRHNEGGPTSGNTDAITPSIRNEVYKRHKKGMTNQPGIDIPTGGITKGRIAIEADGNVFASDDLSAIPFGIGILWKTGHLEDIVHVGYNNNSNPDRHVNTAKDDPSLGQDKEFRAIMNKTTEVFGLNSSIFFDYANASELSNATANLVKEINVSSATNPLYIIQAGVMIYLYNALAASDASKHKFVTIITHSWWNDIECHDSSLNENIIDIVRDFESVKVDYIIDQNYGLRSRKWNKIEWMKASSQDPALKWLHTTARKGDPNRWGFLNLKSEIDISDAGMFYYLVTGKENKSNFNSFKAILSKQNNNSQKTVQEDIRIFTDYTKSFLTIILDTSSRLEIYNANNDLVYSKAYVTGEIVIPKGEIGENGYYIVKVDNITKKIFLE